MTKSKKVRFFLNQVQVDQMKKVQSELELDPEPEPDFFITQIDVEVVENLGFEYDQFNNKRSYIRKADQKIIEYVEVATFNSIDDFCIPKSIRDKEKKKK